MTPLVALPPEAVSPSRGVPVTMVVLRRVGAATQPTEEVTDTDFWPDGIDYDKWAPIAQPAPAGAFADPLDFLDLTED